MLNDLMNLTSEDLEQVKNIWELKEDINMSISYNFYYRSSKTKSAYRKEKKIIKQKQRAFDKIMKNIAK